MSYFLFHIVLKYYGFLQVLFDLFRHDARLWKAYCYTLQVYFITIMDYNQTSISIVHMKKRGQMNCFRMQGPGRGQKSIPTKPYAPSV